MKKSSLNDDLNTDGRADHNDWKARLGSSQISHSTF
jgi:hypothetical protein